MLMARAAICRSHVENAFADLAAQLDGSSGAIVLGFDAVVHGDRRGESDRSAESALLQLRQPAGGAGQYPPRGPPISSRWPGSATAAGG